MKNDLVTRLRRLVQRNVLHGLYEREYAATEAGNQTVVDVLIAAADHIETLEALLKRWRVDHDISTKDQELVAIYQHGPHGGAVFQRGKDGHPIASEMALYFAKDAAALLSGAPRQ